MKSNANMSKALFFVLGRNRSICRRDGQRNSRASRCQLWEVKEALAVYLERPDLLKKIRLVRRVGHSGAFASFKDRDALLPALRDMYAADSVRTPTR